MDGRVSNRPIASGSPHHCSKETRERQRKAKTVTDLRFRRVFAYTFISFPSIVPQIYFSFPESSSRLDSLLAPLACFLALHLVSAVFCIHQTDVLLFPSLPQLGLLVKGFCLALSLLLTASLASREDSCPTERGWGTKASCRAEPGAAVSDGGSLFPCAGPGVWTPRGGFFSAPSSILPVLVRSVILLLFTSGAS